MEGYTDKPQKTDIQQSSEVLSPDQNFFDQYPFNEIREEIELDSFGNDDTFAYLITSDHSGQYSTSQLKNIGTGKRFLSSFARAQLQNSEEEVDEKELLKKGSEIFKEKRDTILNKWNHVRALVDDYPGLREYIKDNTPRGAGSDTRYNRFGKRDERYQKAEVKSYKASLSGDELAKLVGLGEDLDALDIAKPPDRIKAGRASAKSIPNRDWKTRGEVKGDKD